MQFLTEIYGENNTGKTHQAHSGWPNPLHVDTAFTSMGFRQLEVDPDDDRRGESWPVVLKQYDWNETAAANRYRYVAEYDEVWDAIETAKTDDQYQTIIFDNSHDLRVLTAKHWCEQNNTDWPKQEEWGEINDMVDEFFEAATDNLHVVVVSQMTDEYEDGDKTGERVWDGPKRMPFKADFRVALSVADGDRDAEIVKNRFLDRAGDEWVESLGSSISFEDLMYVSGVPEDQW